MSPPVESRVYAPPSDGGAGAGDAAPGERKVRSPAPVATVLGLGLFSFACWLCEIVLVRGWEGLRWLHGFPLAAYPVCLCVSLAVLVTAAWRRRVTLARGATFVVAATLISLLAFTIARDWFLRSRWIAFSGPSAMDVVLSPLLSIALTAAGFHLLVRLLLGKISRLYALLVVAALALTEGASFVTILAIPAVNGSRDGIHSVKMGYPTFWVTVLLAAATALGLWLVDRGASAPAGPASPRRAR